MRSPLSPALTKALVTLVATFVVFVVAAPGFAQQSNVRIIFDSLLVFGLASLALGVTMIAGEFDLSFPAIAALSGLVAMRVADHGMLLGIAAGVLVGAGVGLTQGLIVRFTKIASIVLTLGTSLVILGVAYLAANTDAGSSASIPSPDLGFADTLQRQVWVFTPGSLIAIAVFVLVGLALQLTRIGREITAIGGGRDEATAAGVPVGRAIVVAFIASGMLAGLLGGLVTAEIGGASPTTFSDLLLRAVTAAFIGGVTLRGGEGSPLGIAIGVLTIGMILSGLSLMAVPYYVNDLVIGGLLIVLVVVDLALPAVTRRFTTRRAALATVA